MAIEESAIQDLTPEEIYTEMKLMRGRLDTLRERLNQLCLRNDTIGWKNRAAEAAYCAGDAINHAATMVRTAFSLPLTENGK